MDFLFNLFATLTAFTFLVFPWAVFSLVLFLVASILCIIPIFGSIVAFIGMLLYLVYSCIVLSKVWSNLWLYGEYRLTETFDEITLWLNKSST